MRAPRPLKGGLFANGNRLDDGETGPPQGRALDRTNSTNPSPRNSARARRFTKRASFAWTTTLTRTRTIHGLKSTSRGGVGQLPDLPPADGAMKRAAMRRPRVRARAFGMDPIRRRTHRRRLRIRFRLGERVRRSRGRPRVLVSVSVPFSATMSKKCVPGGGASRSSPRARRSTRPRRGGVDAREENS